MPSLVVERLRVGHQALERAREVVGAEHADDRRQSAVDDELSDLGLGRALGLAHLAAAADGVDVHVDKARDDKAPGRVDDVGLDLVGLEERLGQLEHLRRRPRRRAGP